jgi:hypothetical protein
MSIHQTSSGAPSLRPVKWLIGLFATSLIVLGVAATTTSDPSQTRTVKPPDASYSHVSLQPDADMTQQMSAPNADTGRPNHTNDPQLTRAADAAYLRSLEQHQSDIDRMLARPVP